MPNARSLSRRSILVVEDDFYQACDTERALRAVGAEVVGPVPRAAMALAALAGGDLDAAVVDINLGEGPSFAVADALQRAGVPLVFVTGYDEVSIPERLAHVETVRKPTDIGAISQALIRVLSVP